MRTPIFYTLLMLVALPCPAADHLVYVYDYDFDPKILTIGVNDTVTFKALGNLASHNVHADNESFRCAIGCRGVGGESGDPTKQNFSSTVTFGQKGVVSYHCDNHTGMVGSITVNDAVAAGPPIGPGFSGNWFDPTANKAGHGFQIEILPDFGMLAIWFVFNPAGTAQNWIYSQGTYNPASSTTTLQAFLEQGGTFPPNFDGSKITVPEWGSLQFTFTDCSHGTVAWKSNTASAAAGYADVTFPIQRLTSVAGTTCP